jgi:uncharacterized membrane protein YwzB
MELFQEILVFITLALAIGFLVKKYFLKKVKSSKSYGEDSCGCH